MNKDFFKELKREYGNFQTDYGVLKFVFYLREPFFSWLCNSIETIDIDRFYRRDAE